MGRWGEMPKSPQGKDVVMLKNPEDRRVRRTRRLLKESLLELMRKRRFSELSVRDVTDNADMNRTTFYLHYTDLAQLLRSVETDLLEEAQCLVDAHIQETVADGTVRPVFEPILDFVVEHREICATLFENNEVSRFSEHLQQLIRRNGEEIVRAWFQPTDERQLNHLLCFITYGLIGLLREWFREDMAMPKEQMLTEAEAMVDGAASRLLKRE